MSQATNQNTTVIPALHTLGRTRYERDAIASIAASFAAPFAASTILPALKCCPFCLAEAQCDGAFHGRVAVFCDNDECPAAPQVTRATFQDAAKRWNHHYHPGYVAPEVRS